jgi:hypothetical protein
VNKPLPDEPEALAMLMDSAKKLLEAWEPAIVGYERAFAENRAALSQLERGDMAGFSQFLKHEEISLRIEREIRSNVATYRKVLDIILYEYIDFDKFLNELTSFRTDGNDAPSLVSKENVTTIEMCEWGEAVCKIYHKLFEDVRNLINRITIKYITSLYDRKSPTTDNRIIVCVNPGNDSGTIEIKNHVHHFSMAQADAVKILADAKGLWVTGSKMKEESSLLRPRPDRIIKRLPKAILAYIESGNSGYRLKWEELE